MKSMLPPTLILYCLLGMLCLHWIFPLITVSSAVLFISGVGLIILGILIAVSAGGQFRKSGTTVNTFSQPAKLVVDGWFKYSRNPMYLGFALLLTGAWITLGTFSPFLGVVAFLVVTDRWYIAEEEKQLVAIFGRAYESYRMRTRRWL